MPDLAEAGCRGRLEKELRDGWAPDAVVGRVWRAEGGFSNETWFAEVVVRGVQDTVVVRRQALVGPLEPYDLAREAAIVRALWGGPVPVPAIHLVCEDAAVVGSPFAVMERIEGAVPEYRNLPEYAPWADPRNRTEMARALMRMLARIRSVPVDGGPISAILGGADDTSASPPVVGRVRGILAKLEAQVGRDSVPPVLRDAAAWLIEQAPPYDGPWALVHGDYKVGNFVWRGNEIATVLDWELATIGDPLEDLGYACHPVMRSRAPELMAMLVPFDELLRLHESETGVAVDLQRLHYYLIYALYFHMHTFITGLVAGLRGADVRVALGYAKSPLATRELLRHIRAYDKGDHVL